MPLEKHEVTFSSQFDGQIERPGQSSCFFFRVSLESGHPHCVLTINFLSFSSIISLP